MLAFGLPQPRTHHRIGRYTVDFYWPSHRLVVETDGADYHGHPLAQKRDARKTEALQARGYTVLRIPEEALHGAPARVARLLSPASRTAS